MKNHYTVLGVATDAPPADIRAAFKSACLRTHPDRLPPSCPAEQRAIASALFIACVAAANCLLDPQARSRYDAFVLGVQMIDVAGRISETVTLLDSENSEFEASDPENALLYTRECRCGGTYSIVLMRPVTAADIQMAEDSLKQNDDDDDCRAAAASATLSKRFATCDTCSLVLQVLCPS